MSIQFAEFCKTAQDLSHNALSQLSRLVLELPQNKDLFSYSVHYERVDKLVLYNSHDMRFQIRLHVYSSPSGQSHHSGLIDIEQAHNHRWNFSTRILSGGYHHTIYNSQLSPIMVRYEGVGSCYALHHSQYHSIKEDPNTVSLIVRGPLEKESFQVATLEEGTVQPKDAHKVQRNMNLADYERVVNQLGALKLVGL